MLLKRGTAEYSIPHRTILAYLNEIHNITRNSSKSIALLAYYLSELHRFQAWLIIAPASADGWQEGMLKLMLQYTDSSDRVVSRKPHWITIFPCTSSSTYGMCLAKMNHLFNKPKKSRFIIKQNKTQSLNSSKLTVQHFQITFLSKILHKRCVLFPVGC